MKLKDFGAITTLLGGGRYNGLAEQLGGPSTPGIGFGMGLERLLLALRSRRMLTLPIENELDIFFIAIGEKVQEQSCSAWFNNYDSKDFQ